MGKDSGIWWMDANTHNDNIMNNNKQDDEMGFAHLNFLLNICEKKRQCFLWLSVVLLSDKRRSDFVSARAQVKGILFRPSLLPLQQWQQQFRASPGCFCFLLFLTQAKLLLASKDHACERDVSVSHTGPGNQAACVCYLSCAQFFSLPPQGKAGTWDDCPCSCRLLAGLYLPG